MDKDRKRVEGYPEYRKGVGVVIVSQNAFMARKAKVAREQRQDERLTQLESDMGYIKIMLQQLIGKR